MVRSANNNARGGRARPRVLDVSISALRDVRRALTVEGDIASDVAFQNDVNVLLAAVSRMTPPASRPPADDVPFLPAERAALLPPPAAAAPRRARSATRRG